MLPFAEPLNEATPTTITEPDPEDRKALTEEEHSDNITGPTENEQQTEETKSEVPKEKPAVATDQQEEPLIEAE